MPRSTRQRTQREEVTLNDPRPVQLESTRRFFTASGNDGATREARALASAFSSGTELFGNLAVKRDQKGFDQATADAAAGGSRKEDEKNKGYHLAWDKLDAENDLNETRQELPELLRQFDWENKSVGAVQGFIDDYMRENFDGLDGESAYAEIMAPGLLALESDLMINRREIELDRIKQDQRVKIFENLSDRFSESGVFDYEYLGEQTNIFFDGADKRVVYWESIFDFAIENGAPAIIDNVPERFASGDPTGVTDPVMQDEIRAARNEALSRQARKLKAEQAEKEAGYDADRFHVQLEMLDNVIRGGTGMEQIGKLAGIPGTQITDLSSARNFASSFRDDIHEVNADLPMVAALWNNVHVGNASQQELWGALMRGELGTGRPSIKLFNDMVKRLQTVKEQDEGDNNVEINFWAGQINKLYASNLGGLLTAVDPLQHRVNLAAHSFYRAQVKQGNAPQDAYHETQERFDPIVQNAPPLNEAELNVERRRPQSDFEAAQLVTDSLLKKVGTGEANYVDVFGGINPGVISFRVGQAIEAQTLTDEEAERILTYIYY